MRADVRMCKETCSACVTVKSWDCGFSREPIYNISWGIHARHNHNITSCAKTTLLFRCYRRKQQWLGWFRFNLLSWWRPLTSPSWDWYQLTLQGDIRTHFSISSLSNAAVNLHLDQPSKLTHSVRGVVRTGLYNSVEKLCNVAVIPFGKRHGQWFVSCDSWRQILGNSIIWKKIDCGIFEGLASTGFSAWFLAPLLQNICTSWECLDNLTGVASTTLYGHVVPVLLLVHLRYRTSTRIVRVFEYITIPSLRSLFDYSPESENSKKFDKINYSLPH